MSYRFSKVSPMPVRAEELFAWHASQGAFQRLMPPWQRARVDVPPQGLVNDDIVSLRVRLAPGIWKRWDAQHFDVIPGRRFSDRQLRGPFGSWEHRHDFEFRGERESLLQDEVDWNPPFGLLGKLAVRAIERDLERLFRWRHATTRADLELHARFAARTHLRVAVSGASGTIGTTLCALLTTGGHHVVRLVRREAGPGEVRWDPERGVERCHALEGLDAVVHLAGENVARKRWSTAQKERLRTSRVPATAKLVDSLGTLENPPRAFFCASGMGFYGDAGDDEVDESSKAGTSLLAKLAVDWEEAAMRAEEFGARVVLLRIGMVLDPAGGALAKMLPSFLWGAGAKLGDGRTWWSWIDRDDVAAAILFALQEEAIRGPLVLASPEPVRQAEFAKTLARVLWRPAFSRVPKIALKAIAGEMAEEILLRGAKGRPAGLLDAGFEFRRPRLETSLRGLLGRS